MKTIIGDFARGAEDADMRADDGTFIHAIYNSCSALYA
jgi:hypothetical protein